MKIAIIGYSGSGKSTLAEKLSNYYSIPKLHMDTLQFQPGWQDSDCEWMLTEIKNFLTKHKAWGSFLNFSPLTCLFRAFKRYLKYRGKVRESMAADCPERFEWEFIRWILWDGRSKTQKENYQKL
ncbi:topology modulation protein [Streptococcus pneumoniae]|uniref:Topology modulation protein n=1 Tax=Streptococcus pneumoniae TaxID=1313 RepID=A0AA86X6J8_STREE|nr:topology modulation protein [Streptococcus pneumoniae]CIS81909.1 topology modulation protein [Streptococcus pneumoniae]CIZ09998.1 topology modulation protein [Streptococcus pneumoniae]CJV43437.1 topology modulation protein [Streptococcus pneumoniae]CJW98305.1 topology modulation protein [Streptococcus pneumoniae]